MPTTNYILTSDVGFISEDELYHYGVLGMKWGVRHRRRKDAKRQFRKREDKAFKEYEKTIADIEKPYRRGQKMSNSDYDREVAADKKYRDEVRKAKDAYKKAKKDRSKDAAIANKLYSKQSKEANERITQMSTGKAIAQSFLLSSYGSLKYNEAKSRGVSTGMAAVEAILYTAGNQATGGLLSAGKYLDNRFARHN